MLHSEHVLMSEANLLFITFKVHFTTKMETRVLIEMLTTSMETTWCYSQYVYLPCCDSTKSRQIMNKTICYLVSCYEMQMVGLALRQSIYRSRCEDRSSESILTTITLSVKQIYFLEICLYTHTLTSYTKIFAMDLKE